jgi:hypothetical protein
MQLNKSSLIAQVNRWQALYLPAIRKVAVPVSG